MVQLKEIINFMFKFTYLFMKIPPYKIRHTNLDITHLSHFEIRALLIVLEF